MLQSVLLLVTPTVAMLVAGVDVWYWGLRGNSVDPFIYVGVVGRLHDYLLRFPDGYYSYRFGYVLPEWAFERVLGFHAGFLVIRLLLLGLLAIALRRLARMTLAATMLALGVLLLSPIVHRAVFSTYTESLSVAFLLLGVVLLVRAGDGTTGSVRRWGASGVILGLAWNAHFATLPVVGAAIVLVFIDVVFSDRPRSVRRHLPPLAAVIAGMAAVVVAGTAVYGIRFGVWDVYGPTLAFAREAPAKVYLETNGDWFTWRHYLLVIPLALTGGWLGHRSSTVPDVRAELRRLGGIVVAALFVFGVPELTRSAATLSVYYYSSFPLVLALLLLARSLAALLAARATAAAWWVTALTVVASLVTYGALDDLHPVYGTVVALTVVAGAVASLVARIPRWSAGAGPVLVVAAAFVTVSSPHDFPAASASFRTDPTYDASLFRYDWSGAEVYAAASAYARALPSLPNERGQIRVWFDAGAPSPMLQAQSTILAYTSALQVPGEPGPPTLTEFDKARLAIDRPRFVVVLDTTEAEVDAATDAVLAQDQRYEVRWTRQFGGGGARIVATLLERSEGTWRDYPCTVDGRAGSLCP